MKSKNVDKYHRVETKLMMAFLHRLTPAPAASLPSVEIWKSFQNINFRHRVTSLQNNVKSTLNFSTLGYAAAQQSICLWSLFESIVYLL